MGFNLKSSIKEVLNNNDSFCDYLQHYIGKNGYSHNKFAKKAKMTPLYLTRILNANGKNVSIDTLMCICLTLHLSLEKSLDLMARAERTLSPASKSYNAYIYLINLFSNTDSTLDLDYANSYLKEHNLPPIEFQDYVN